MYRSKQKSIPTLLALLILIGGIGATVYLEQSSQNIQSLAKEEAKPEDVHFTNITDKSFTVSWLTKKSSLGSVTLSNNLAKKTLLDDADSDNVPKSRKTHYITVNNLTQDTTYSIKIISGNKSCRNKELCPTFTQKTGVKLSTKVDLPAPRGTITTKEGNPAKDAIVYLTVGKSSPLSGRTDSSGIWAISLNNLRSQDLLSGAKISDDTIVQINTKLSPSETTSAVIDVQSIRQNLAIPNMQIGSSYNFIDLLSKKDLLAKNINTNILGVDANLNTVSDTLSNISSQSKVEMHFPKKNDDITPDYQPRLRGVGIPGKQLLITINSTPQSGRVTVKPDGTWEWRPPNPLSPGIHHISIQYYDDNGNIVNVKRRFIVLKSGENVLGDATPSASITPTLSPTISATPSATIFLTPTSSPTPTSYLIASPTPTTPPPTNTPIMPPRTGDIKPTLIFLGGSISLFLIGLKFLLFG